MISSIPLPFFHPPLPTFQKFNHAKLKRAVSVTAIDRLEYLGLFRLQLFHMVRSDPVVEQIIKLSFQSNYFRID